MGPQDLRWTLENGQVVSQPVKKTFGALDFLR